jgi:hypothetical protein
MKILIQYNKLYFFVFQGTPILIVLITYLSRKEHYTDEKT